MLRHEKRMHQRQRNIQLNVCQKVTACYNNIYTEAIKTLDDLSSKEIWRSVCLLIFLHRYTTQDAKLLHT